MLLGVVFIMCQSTVMTSKQAELYASPEPTQPPQAQPKDDTETILIVVITALITLVCVFVVWLCYRKWCHRYRDRATRGHQPDGGQYGSGGPPSLPEYSSAPPVGEHTPNTSDNATGDIQPEVGIEMSQVQVQTQCTNTDNGVQNATNQLQCPTDDMPSTENIFDPKLRDLFSVSERSMIKSVSGKLVFAVTHNVDHRGDVLFLDNVGVSLTIPPGAILEGNTEIICLALNWDLSDNPDMESRHTLVSPVVYCGPHGLKLHKPCILSYRHCAYDPGDIKIMVSETELMETKVWQQLCESRELEGRCEVTHEECRVKLHHFSLVSCIQSRSDEHPGKKWIQIVAFTSPLQKGIDHYQVRVYFLNKTPCALEWAIHNEATFGGSKCCPEKVFLYDGDGKDMFLEMVYLSDDWDAIDGCQFEKISFLQIWHGHCPHVSTCVRRKTNPRNRGEEINIHFLAYQEEHANNPERLIIHMTEDKTLTSSNTGNACINQTHGLGKVILKIPGSNYPPSCDTTLEVTAEPNHYTVVNIQPGKNSIDLEQVNQAMSSVFKVPEELKQKLIMLLDPTATFGNNWRQLAVKLDLDGAIRFLETLQPSPTMALLQFMEHKDMCLERLFSILEEMGRKDASRVVSRYITRNGDEHQEMLPNEPVEVNYD